MDGAFCPSNAVTRLQFENSLNFAEMDAFSVVDLSTPPRVLKQPSSATVVPGGTVAFSVSAEGAPTLNYQWYHNGAALPGATNRILVLSQASAADAGYYVVSVTNSLGATMSITATLQVENSSAATIVVQPNGGLLPAGSYVVINVIATGTAPLHYQWHRDGQPLDHATNRHLIFTNFSDVHAGTYEVKVGNVGGSVWSLPATLIATNQAGGGYINFRNGRFPVLDPVVNAPIYDIDGVSPLNGNRYVAQLYAGLTAENLRPAGDPVPFIAGFGAGYFMGRSVALPNVPPMTLAQVQVRVWEASFGASYEEARALGGKFGRSEVLAVIAGGGTGAHTLPANLTGLTSFSLQAGLPGFTTGRLQLQQQLPNGQAVWSLQGESGFRYLVEQTAEPNQLVWRPYLLLTNSSGNTSFTVDPSSENTFFRARILD
jgi:hypothetical protein